MNVLGYADDGRDALMRAALGSPRDARAAWSAWCAAGVDPDRDPVAERWMPLVGWNLDADLDAHARERLHAARRRAWASNVRLLDAARPAVLALANAGIPVMLLKGAALALTVYETPGLRPIGDVDVLVPPGEGARARAILARAGWRQLHPVSERNLPLRHACNLCRPPHGELDLHWHALAECAWPDADAGFWRRARPLPGGDLPVSVLGPADQLVHVCVHGLRWSPVHAGHWVADAVRILDCADRIGPTLDWSVVLDEARRRQVGFQLYEALRCVAQFERARVPDEALRALRNLPASPRDRLECRLKGRPVVSAGGFFVLWCGWARTARATPGRGPSWLRYLAAMVGVDTERQLIPWFARHARNRARALFARRPRRGASSRERFDHREPA